MKIKTLDRCDFEKSYLIYKVDLTDQKLLKHLENLFIKSGEKICVLHKSYRSKASIVKVLGINYAMEKEIIEKILVYDA